MAAFVFMGEQDDPEMEVLLSRGITRVYNTVTQRDYRCRPSAAS